jgi:transcriptional regulator with XRE-family HTH domain
MARPTNISIVGNRVLDERKRRKVTQEKLARQVYEEAGMHVPDRDALERRCRDWESGKISRKFLAALSRVLELDEQYLQGGSVPGPMPDRLTQIVRQLNEQQAAGNVYTQQFIEHVRHAATLGVFGTIADERDLIEEAARALEARLGAALLTARAEQLDWLQAITGWSRDQVLRPGSSHGYWLVVSEGPLGGLSKIERGVAAMLTLVGQEIELWVNGRSCDSRATLKDESPWFRIQLEDPSRPQRSTTISMVRCEPTATGLEYCSPSQIERLYLGIDPWPASLSSTLESHFNYLRDFGDNAPWTSFEEMRLELLDVSDRSPNAQALPLSRFAGDIEHFRNEALANLAGAEHSAAMTWLASDLIDDLREYLDHWPRECWRASAGSGVIVIRLDTGNHIPRQLGRSPVSVDQFVLRLVRECADGTVAALPCVRDSLQNLLDRVSWAIADLPSAAAPDQLFVGPPRHT